MPRVKRGTVRRAERKKLAKLTKGYFLNRSKLYRAMKEAADRAGRFAYRDRRRRKRDFRRLWIIRIGAAARLNQLTYSQFINGLKNLNIGLDRKMLAEMAVRDAAGFAELAAKVKAVVESQKPAVESQKSTVEKSA
ncbi:MAG TPA: 50S ribosomal protein L20 [Terriglobia bacterium]|nr:50S ribosomal protein L20 [Terriglobia bacterium]